MRPDEKQRNMIKSPHQDPLADIIVQVFDHAPYRVFLKYAHPVRQFIQDRFALLRQSDDGWDPVEGDTLVFGSAYWAVSRRQRPIAMSFCGLNAPGRFAGMDLVVEGQWEVAGPQLFLDSYGHTAAFPNAPLRRMLAESWITHTMGLHLQGVFSRIESLQSLELGSTDWLRPLLAQPLAGHGIRLEVDGCRFEPPDAVRARLQKQRTEDFARLDAERDSVASAISRRVLLQIQFEAERSRLAGMAYPTSSMREDALEKLERARCRDLMLSEIKIASARLAWNKATLQHETAMARAANHAEGVKKAMSKLYEAERDHRRVMAFYTQAQNTLSKIARIAIPVLSVLSGHDPVAAHQMAERLISSEFGFGADGLLALGYAVQSQALVQALRRKNMADGESIRIKSLSAGRDAGTAPVKTLKINSQIRFEFLTQRGGCLTILNIGSSGFVHVQAPNFFVPDPRVEADRMYTVPGPEIMPLERLLQSGLDYVETGPPGWEHMAVIVSEKPIIAREILSRGTAAAPFVRLQQQEFDDLCFAINQLPVQEWTSNFLSFLVIHDTQS